MSSGKVQSRDTHAVQKYMSGLLLRFAWTFLVVLYGAGKSHVGAKIRATPECSHWATRPYLVALSL